MNPRVRLRQAVFVAEELEPLCGELASHLGLGAPFNDPGVAEFGLVNAVFCLGDCFIEVIAPTQPQAPASRYLERFGPGGYMVLFDLEDLEGARERTDRLGVRVVWQIDLPDISGTHLHPLDMPGAIVSLDRSVPYGTWRWGGPDWTGKLGGGAPGHLAGVTIAVEDPDATAARWGEVLGVEPSAGPALELHDGRVSFRALDTREGAGTAAHAEGHTPEGAGGGRQGLVEIQLERRPGASLPDELELGGVTLRTTG